MLYDSLLLIILIAVIRFCYKFWVFVKMIYLYVIKMKKLFQLIFEIFSNNATVFYLSKDQKDVKLHFFNLI